MHDIDPKPVGRRVDVFEKVTQIEHGGPWKRYMISREIGRAHV